MQSVWVYNVPCKKDLTSLNEFYSNYEGLKMYLFDLLKRTGIFKDMEPGKKVVIKPNWVYQNTIDTDEDCLTTNPNFILAVLEFILLYNPASVIIGDAPIQSCNWELLIPKRFLQQISEFQNITNVPISVVDFRNEKWEDKKTLQRNCRNNKDYVLYDLATDSLLDPLSIQNKTFRVGDYAPEETIKFHKAGTHKYLIAKEAIDADIIINLPKLKTHQKAGITNGLKNYVGTIGEKVYLAHHSSNLSESGGDCYPGNNYIRKIAEYLRENSSKYKGSILYYLFHNLASVIWRLAPKSDYASLGGAWYGNDTVWRMVLDINKIISYGTLAGGISATQQRKIVTISDAIISGQGNGPLKPEPNPMGMVSISNNDMLLDIVMASLMNFDNRKIPLLNYYAGSINSIESEILLDDNNVGINELIKFSIRTKPAKGWVGHIEFS